MDESKHNTIREACSRLDLANDEHWTTTGEPVVAVVRSLASDDSITRTMIQKIAPECNRPAARSAAEAAAPPPAEPSEYDRVCADIELCKAYMAEQRQMELEARQRLAEADEALNVMIKRRDELDPLASHRDFVKHWQARQQEERARQAAAPTLVAPSNLDRALQDRRNKARPTFERGI